MLCAWGGLRFRVTSPKFTAHSSLLLLDEMSQVFVNYSTSWFIEKGVTSFLLVLEYFLFS